MSFVAGSKDCVSQGCAPTSKTSYSRIASHWFHANEKHANHDNELEVVVEYDLNLARSEIDVFFGLIFSTVPGGAHNQPVLRSRDGEEQYYNDEFSIPRVHV